MYKMLSQFSLYLLLINSRKTNRKLQCGRENKDKCSIYFSAPACHVSITCTVYTETWPQPLGSKQPKNNCSRTEGNKTQDRGCNIWAYMSSAAEMGQFLFDRSDVKCFQKSAFFSSVLHTVVRALAPNMHNSRLAVLLNATRGLKYKLEIRFFSVSRPINISLDHMMWQLCKKRLLLYEMDKSSSYLFIFYSRQLFFLTQVTLWYKWKACCKQSTEIFEIWMI